MLLALSIKDIVLIDRLDLAVGDGLCVLTGETGAGKSVLLDALSLALGRRGDSALLRQDARQGAAVAEFALGENHPARELLSTHELEVDGPLVLRRTLSEDGRSRAFINDHPVSVGLLRQVGELLVEIHGQHDMHGLLDPSTHRGLLDEFAGLSDVVATCRQAWRMLQSAQTDLASAKAAAEKAREEEDYLRHALAELDDLEPREGEEDELLRQRQLLKEGEKIADALRAAEQDLADGDGVDSRLRNIVRDLERVAGAAGGLLDPAISQLDFAAEQTALARDALAQTSERLDLDPRKLESLDDRLFALRDLARKHRAALDDLPKLHREIASTLDRLDRQESVISELEARLDTATNAYSEITERLSMARRLAAGKLDNAVRKELPPLALDKAVFNTEVATGGVESWGPDGADSVAFKVATNPGQTPGQIHRIASGGELSRFMLALRVAARKAGVASTLIFDEVDSGVGGATADRVGDRLARLAAETQVILVTHSPQVAARGDQHYRISKSARGKAVRTQVETLDSETRLEEIARMLAGAKITDEARAAAEALIAEGQRR